MNADLAEIALRRDDDVQSRGKRRVAAALRAELRQAMARAAAVWRDCGVEPGESVAIALPSHAESLVACLGVAEAGAVAVLVDPASSAKQIEQLRSAGGWRFILCESRELQPPAIRDFVLTRAEWRQALAAVHPETESPATIAA